MAYGSAPQWLDKQGVRIAGYFCDTKERKAAEMQSAVLSPLDRLHACLVLHSAPYQQELCVRMENGVKIPLTPAEVCRMSGIDRRNFSRYMKELASEGLARCEGTGRGSVRLYSWVRPGQHIARSAGVQACGARARARKRLSSRARQSDRQFSDRTRRFFRREKFSLPDGIVIARDDIEWMDEAADIVQEAENVARARMECIRARYVSGPLNKEERLERQEDISSSSSQNEAATTTEGAHEPPVPPDAAPVCPPAPEPRIEPAPENGRDTPRASVRPDTRTERKRAVPRPRQSAAKNGGDRRHDGRRADHVPLKKLESCTGADPSAFCPPVVAEAVREAVAAVRFGIADQPWIDRLWREAKSAAPDITADDLVYCIHAKADTVWRTARKNPLGLLRTSVVNLCGPASLAQVRRDIAARRQTEAAAQARLEREVRAWYADASDDEKEQLRKDYGFLSLI